MSVAKVATFPAAVRWTAFSPFANLSTTEHKINLLGGPGMNPDSVYMYQSHSDDSGGSSLSINSQASGTISFQLIQEKKVSCCS